MTQGGEGKCSPSSAAIVHCASKAGVLCHYSPPHPAGSSIFFLENHHLSQRSRSHVNCEPMLLKPSFPLIELTCLSVCPFYLLPHLTRTHSHLMCVCRKAQREKSRGAKGLQLEVGAQPSSHHLLPREGLFQGLVPATSICAAELLLKGKDSFFLEKFFPQNC